VSTPAIVLPWQGRRPWIAADAFVAPGASVIGDVNLGGASSVWFGCVLRGDERAIHVGAGSNLQDLTVVHTSRRGWDAVIGADVTVGHRAVLHGCRIEDGCFIGIGAILLDEVVVESGAIVAAGALVTPGKRVPAGEVWAGSPARKFGEVSPDQVEMIRSTPPHYRAKAAAYLAAGSP
jgi:carbonic anhydrase/acetyltransferase-like protein (isoleucine patch superfamily)